MGAKVNTAVLKSPRGLLKIICLCFVIIDLVLARTGFAYGNADLTHHMDAKWVNITSVCSYCFILPIIILCYLLGEEVSVKMEMMFQFLGAVLFLTSGSLVVDTYKDVAGDDGDVGLALGSMTIITGFFMFFDFMVLGKEAFSKK